MKIIYFLILSCIELFNPDMPAPVQGFLMYEKGRHNKSIKVLFKDKNDVLKAMQWEEKIPQIIAGVEICLKHGARKASR